MLRKITRPEAVGGIRRLLAQEEHVHERNAMCDHGTASASHPRGNTSGMIVGNPFSTRHTRPGVIPFCFAPGPKFRQLIERLWDTGCWGQIVGPHGSGKSTLVSQLIDQAADYGIRTVSFTLHDNQRGMPTGWKNVAWNAFEVGRMTLIIVDGFEQLSGFSRWRLRHTCRNKSWGLLVTAHADVGLPNIYRTRTTIELAYTLVEYLVAETRETISRQDVQQTFRRHDGNLRQVFSDLYDQYERQRQGRCH